MLVKNLAVCFVVSAITLSAAEKKVNEEIFAVFETSKGNITCILYPEFAPKTVDNFIGLAEGKKEWTDPVSKQKIKKPLYNGTIFHRVIPNFMIQGGDPLGRGIGGPGYTFKDECSPNLKFDKPGRLAMANSGPNTNGSQFFITVVETSWLNNKHTIFGQVTEGQKIVDEITKVKRNAMDKPLEPVILKNVKIIRKPK
jgi:peptidyl-prolyl cis-trans isomerase A (cyclophilin A)